MDLGKAFDRVPREVMSVIFMHMAARTVLEQKCKVKFGMQKGRALRPLLFAGSIQRV